MNITLTHLRALVALEKRMDEGPARDRIRARIEETREAALRGMPDGKITTGELHTAYRHVFDHGAASAQAVANKLDCSRTRAGNALRMLEEAGLVTNQTEDDDLLWTCTDTNTPDKDFDTKFPGLVTIDKSGTSRKPKPQHKPTQHKEMPTMATTIEFTKDTSKDSNKKYGQVVDMINLLRKSPDPIPFATLCEKVGAKYPQDIQAAMFALEITGTIDRYSYVEEGSTRSRTAYKWSQEDDAPRPTKRSSGASKRRSPATSKKATQNKAEEATPAAA
jgi:hypothetical protein